MPDRNAICTVGPRTATKPNITLLRRAMKGLGAKTPVEMADLLGYNDTTIRRILAGDQKVSVDLFKALKAHVGLVEALRICNLADEAELQAVVELQVA